MKEKSTLKKVLVGAGIASLTVPVAFGLGACGKKTENTDEGTTTPSVTAPSTSSFVGTFTSSKTTTVDKQYTKGSEDATGKTVTVSATTDNARKLAVLQPSFTVTQAPTTYAYSGVAAIPATATTVAVSNLATTTVSTFCTDNSKTIDDLIGLGLVSYAPAYTTDKGNNVYNDDASVAKYLYTGSNDAKTAAEISALKLTDLFAQTGEAGSKTIALENAVGTGAPVAGSVLANLVAVGLVTPTQTAGAITYKDGNTTIPSADLTKFKVVIPFSTNTITFAEGVFAPEVKTVADALVSMGLVQKADYSNSAFTKYVESTRTVTTSYEIKADGTAKKHVVDTAIVAPATQAPDINYKWFVTPASEFVGNPYETITLVAVSGPSIGSSETFTVFGNSLFKTNDTYTFGSDVFTK